MTPDHRAIHDLWRRGCDADEIARVECLEPAVVLEALGEIEQAVERDLASHEWLALGDYPERPSR